MERINKVFRNGEPLSAEELNGIVRYINLLGDTIEENLDDWSSENAVEEMWNSLKEDDDSNRIHSSHSPLSYPLSSINSSNLGQPPYSDMTITSDGNGGWLWKKINQGGGGGGGSSQGEINKLRIYFLNVTHGIIPLTPSVNNYNSPPQDNFINGLDTWTYTNTNPTNELDTYAIWVWFLSNVPVNIDGPIKIFDGSINSSNGEDGEEIEWIYRRVSVIPSESTLNSWENTLANCVGEAQARDGKTFENEDAIPFDWYDNPLGVTYLEKYEYASFRRSVNNENGKRVWGTTGFCRPFIWSTYGEKGMDGDGIEYIYWAKAEAVNNWTTFGLNQENASNYPPGWTNNEGFQNNEYMGPENSSWTDDPQGINSTTRRFIYVSTRKKTTDPNTGISSWLPFSEPALWTLFVDLPSNGINGSYILEVYRNDSAAVLTDLSNRPGLSGFDNTNYPPTGWTASPQQRSEGQYTWCMQRTVGYDEYNIASPGDWGTPFRLTGDDGDDGTDGRYLEFIYKRFTSELTFGNNLDNPHSWSITNNNQNSPNNPLREDYTGPTDHKWNDNPQGVNDEYLYEYVALRIFNGTTYEAFSNPILWSKYGENGRDGDGFEYIFKGFSSEQTSWDANSDDYPPKWITSDSTNFLTNDYLGPTGHLWADDTIGVDSVTNKFVYVCSRKKYVDLGASRATWHTFSTPKLWAQYVPPGGQGPQGPNGAFTLFIFKNSSLDLSASGNYNELSTSTSSIPPGWSLTATNPSSSEYIWGSHRLITYNTSNEAQYGAWITPYRISGNDGNAVNGGHYEFRYKNYATLPNAPTGTGNTDGWSSSPSTPSASEKYTWMSLTYVSGTGLYGTWTTPIRLTGEDGQPGTDGNSIEFIYTRNNTGVAPAAPPTNGTYPNDWSGTDSNGVIWTDNPLGVASNMMWEYVCQRVKLNGTWGNYEPNPAAVWSKWGEKGQDGDGYEYIFKHFTTELTFGNDDNNPAYWGTNLTDGYLGPNNYQWSNNPVGVNSNEKFEYVAIRKRVSGTWGQFSSPTLWSRYSAQGADGGRYIFMYQNYTPSNPPSIVPDGTTSYTVSQLTNVGWAYTASTPNFQNGLYTYMTLAFFADLLSSAVWTVPIRITGDNGLPGEDGKYTEFIYKRFTTEQTFGSDNNNPAYWEPSQNGDYLGPNSYLWSDNPLGITSTYKFEYISEREYDGINFGRFTTPVIWSKWGEKGMDGDGLEYIYKHFTTEQTFSTGNGNPANWAANQNSGYLGPTGDEWSDNPVGISSTYKFEYVSVRKKENGTWGTFSTPSLWSNYADTTVITPASTTVYQLVATISEIRYKRNHAGVVVWMPSSFDLQLFKFEGTTFTLLNSLPSGFSLSRVIDGTNTASINGLGTINTSTIASYTSGGTPVMGSRVFIKLLSGGNDVTCLNLSIVREFQRMLIPMGAYVNKRYDITDTTIPLVLGSNGKYYYLDADTNRVNNTNIDPTTSGQTVWGEAAEYEVILTKALFADFAKLGSFVIYGKYFFSLFGYLIDNNGSTYINSTSTAPAAYAHFDPNDPMVDTLPSSGNLKFRPCKVINAETGEEWSASGNVHMSPDGSVSVKGDILATSLTAGESNTLHIVTTADTNLPVDERGLMFYNLLGTLVGGFYIDANGYLLLKLLGPNGSFYNVNWNNWNPLTANLIHEWRDTGEYGVCDHSDDLTLLSRGQIYNCAINNLSNSEILKIKNIRTSSSNGLHVYEYYTTYPGESSLNHCYHEGYISTIPPTLADVDEGYYTFKNEVNDVLTYTRIDQIYSWFNSVYDDSDYSYSFNSGVLSATDYNVGDNESPGWGNINTATDSDGYTLSDPVIQLKLYMRYLGNYVAVSVLINRSAYNSLSN